MSVRPNAASIQSANLDAFRTQQTNIQTKVRSDTIQRAFVCLSVEHTEGPSGRVAVAGENDRPALSAEHPHYLIGSELHMQRSGWPDGDLMRETTVLDCLVVGGGPAGLTAALYLARFHLSVCVLDRGDSRAATIPRTHNHSGFPEGITGPELVGRMRDHARQYGAAVETGEVEQIQPIDGGFIATAAGREIATRTVLLATGVRDRRPAMPVEIHDEALTRSLLRYCPICDGFEVTDKKIAVLGAGAHGIAEAKFLLSYTPDVTLITQAGTGWCTADVKRDLDAIGLRVLEGPARSFTLSLDHIHLELESGSHAFDSVYPALGCDCRLEPVSTLDLKLSEKGAIITDQHQQTSIPGIYAAGDVVEGINQISQAMGQAAVAATAIRNALNARSPLRRGRATLSAVEA